MFEGSQDYAKKSGESRAFSHINGNCTKTFVSSFIIHIFVGVTILILAIS